MSRFVPIILTVAAWLAPAGAAADALGDWNRQANEIVIAARISAPAQFRATAIVQTAVYEAVVASRSRAGVSVDAAIAAANRATLLAVAGGQASAVDGAYRAALAEISDGAEKTEGIAAGENAAAAVLARRSDDRADAAESYRPRTAAGVYVPTVLPVATTWPGRKPWVLARADELRPGPPPDLKSTRWARDYNEIKALGGKDGSRRTAEQTAIARFWEMTGPAIYFPLVRSVTAGPGRDVVANARLLAMAGQAMDDAAIAVFDAKYQYGFWRPITAIRNGDLDGNDATERDPRWVPFLDTPMHPEYPCAHCTFAGAVAGVIAADVGGAPLPKLSTASASAGGAVRSWSSLDEFLAEVANARIYDGVHFRTSTEVGTKLGREVGALVAKRFLGR